MLFCKSCLNQFILVQVLLSTDESLQIAAVQCVKIVLDQCPDFCKDLLAADIAGEHGPLFYIRINIENGSQVLTQMTWRHISWDPLT